MSDSFSKALLTWLIIDRLYPAAIDKLVPALRTAARHSKLRKELLLHTDTVLLSSLKTKEGLNDDRLAEDSIPDLSCVMPSASSLFKGPTSLSDTGSCTPEVLRRCAKSRATSADQITVENSGSNGCTACSNRPTGTKLPLISAIRSPR